MKNFKNLLGYFLLLSWCLPLTAQELAHACHSRQDGEDFKAFIDEQIKQGGLHGLALGIIEPKGIIYAQGFGKRDETKPVEADTIFRIASVSKTVTSTAMMMAIRKGLISCETDVNEQQVKATGEPLLPFPLRNPNFPKAPITPREIVDFYGSIHDTHMMYGLYNNNRDMADFLSGYLQPDGAYYTATNWTRKAPGTLWVYSNTATTLIAYLTGRSANTTFDAFCDENLFKPLKMADTTWNHEDVGTNKAARLAFPFASVNGKYQTAQPAEPYPFYPSGGLFTSINDMARFVQMLLNDGELDGVRYLNPGSAKEFGAGAKLPKCTYESSAMWFRPSHHPGLRLKLGSSYGITTMMVIDYDNKRGYLAFANGRLMHNPTTSVTALAQIMNCLLKEKPPLHPEGTPHVDILSFCSLVQIIAQANTSGSHCTPAAP